MRVRVRVRVSTLFTKIIKLIIWTRGEYLWLITYLVQEADCVGIKASWKWNFCIANSLKQFIFIFPTEGRLHVWCVDDGVWVVVCGWCVVVGPCSEQ